MQIGFVIFLFFIIIIIILNIYLFGCAGSCLWHAGSFSCGMWDLVPWPGIDPGPPALGARSLNHWTTREVPNYYLFSFCPHCTACGILVPWPGIESVSPVVEVWSLNHCAAREVPGFCYSCCCIRLLPWEDLKLNHHLPAVKLFIKAFKIYYLTFCMSTEHLNGPTGMGTVVVLLPAQAPEQWSCHCPLWTAGGQLVGLAKCWWWAPGAVSSQSLCLRLTIQWQQAVN